jgi:hypothetical protein
VQFRFGLYFSPDYVHAKEGSVGMILGLVIMLKNEYFEKGGIPRFWSRDHVNQNGDTCIAKIVETRPPLHIDECWSQLRKYLKVKLY